MVFQKILLVPIPFVQRKKPISKRANQTPNDSVVNPEFYPIPRLHKVYPRLPKVTDGYQWLLKVTQGSPGLLKVSIKALQELA